MILRHVLAVKLHGLCVTRSELYYSGSINLPESVCEKVGLRPGDQVSIYNFNSGSRYETYVLPSAGEDVIINGPSARLSQVGDRIVVAQYVLTDEDLTPKVLFFNSKNESVELSEVF